jgi:DNA-binding response OmpR family regulator
MTAPTVLLIEDDPSMLRGLTDNFEGLGYSVRTAREGREGLQAALGSPPDLILLDIMLPGMNGYEICRALRARKLEMPIIMLTAKGQEDDIVRGLELGADDYVTKPFSIRELMARANGFLRRGQKKSDEVIAFGACRLDLRAHRLFRAEQEIFPTTKEFRLLEFFATRPGRALTRDQILNAVWGRDIIVNDRSVDRCVTTLRAKIEQDPQHPTFIQTIRDVGYRFEIAEPSH